jgi:hypothetical protein
MLYAHIYICIYIAFIKNKNIIFVDKVVVVWIYLYLNIHGMYAVLTGEFKNVL